MTAEQKRLFARQMETFAGFAEHTDHEVGRLVDALETSASSTTRSSSTSWATTARAPKAGPKARYNEMLALNGIVGNVPSR